MEYFVLVLLSLGHLMTDLASGLAHYKSAGVSYPNGIDINNYTFMYNLAAFGIQPFLGLALDYCRLYKAAILAGFLCIIFSLFYSLNPLIANVFAGTGNALYHLGAGIIIIRLFPHKAWALGVFVGHGAIGISLSKKLVSGYWDYITPITVILLFLAVLISLLTIPVKATEKNRDKTHLSVAVVIILLMILSTLIRSVVGLSVVFSWKAIPLWGIMLMIVTALGKMSGGFAADRWGGLLTAVSALLISAPLLAWGNLYPVTGLLGVLLFQSTMAITLLVLYEQMPNHPGLAFGLLCFGLWMGTFIVQDLNLTMPSQPILYCGLIILSGICLGLGLWLHKRKQSLL